MKEDQKLVTIAEYDNSMDAKMDKLALDEAGIESVIMGENVASSLKIELGKGVDNKKILGQIIKALKEQLRTISQ